MMEFFNVKTVEIMDKIIDDEPIFIEWDCPSCHSEFINYLPKDRAVPIFCKHCKTLLEF